VFIHEGHEELEEMCSPVFFFVLFVSFVDKRTIKREADSTVFRWKKMAPA